ncbi:hypothetical protein SLA2020_041910 [Shorea laevis]
MSLAAGFFFGLQGRGRRRAERASGWEEISRFKSCSPSRKERENSSSLPVLKGEASAALGGSFREVEEKKDRADTCVMRKKRKKI